MSVSPWNPLVGAPPPEVPLPNAPLERVIAQVRFPLVVGLNEEGALVARYQEAVRRDYPVLRPERSAAFHVGAQGVYPGPHAHVWRFFDVTGTWHAALGQDFLALVCTRYTSRADFLGRWRQLLSALATTVNPAQVDRLGVRYVDRVRKGAPAELRGLVRDEMAGLLGTPLAEHTYIGLSEHVFQLPGDPGVSLRARWGWLPAQQTYEPSVVAADPSGSWILDLDAFRGPTAGFDADDLCDTARRLAERIYAFFRWSVTDDFLRSYGGKP